MLSSSFIFLDIAAGVIISVDAAAASLSFLLSRIYRTSESFPCFLFFNIIDDVFVSVLDVDLLVSRPVAYWNSARSDGTHAQIMMEATSISDQYVTSTLLPVRLHVSR